MPHVLGQEHDRHAAPAQLTLDAIAVLESGVEAWREVGHNGKMHPAGLLATLCGVEQKASSLELALWCTALRCPLWRLQHRAPRIHAPVPEHRVPARRAEVLAARAQHRAHLIRRQRRVAAQYQGGYAGGVR